MNLLFKGVLALGASCIVGGFSESASAQTKSEGPDMPPPPEHRPTAFPSPRPISSPGKTPMPASTGGTTPPIFLPPQIAPMDFKPWNTVPSVDRFQGGGNGSAGSHGGNTGGHGGSAGGTNPDEDYLRRLRERVRALALLNNRWFIGPYGWAIYSDGSYWYPGYGYNDYYNRPLIEGTASTYDQSMSGQDARAQQAALAANRPPANDRERGDAALLNNNVKSAIDAYRRYLLTDGSDAIATRSLGIALLMAGNSSDACSVVRRAYTLDTTLSLRPFDLASLPRDGLTSTELVQRAVREAQRNRSSSAWLTAAMIAQAEGRTSVALTMLEKGRKEGLDSKIADRFAEALEAKIALSPNNADRASGTR
jgi:hypothetical protein